MDAVRARRPRCRTHRRATRGRAAHGWLRCGPANRRALSGRDRAESRPRHRASGLGDSCRSRSARKPNAVLNKTVYELAGGEPALRRLVQRFYSRVAADPVLRPIYPEKDLSAATERLTLFLIQYWGGPST